MTCTDASAAYVLRGALLALGVGCTPEPESPKPGELLAGGPVVCELYDGSAVCATVGQEASYPPAKGIPGVTLSTLSMSGSLLCGLDPQRAIHCYGFDKNNILDVPSGTWSEVAAGNSHACALDATGAPTCWGADYDHALDVPAGLRVHNLVVGDNRSCAQRLDSDDWTCWGSDTTWAAAGVTLGVPGAGVRLTSPSMSGSALYGVHEDGTLGYYGYPDDPRGRHLVPTGDGYTSVDAGNRNACALHTSGRIDCWGSNESGQGDIPDGEWTDVAAGDTMVCGRRSDGVVVCWGCGGECADPLPDLP